MTEKRTCRAPKMLGEPERCGKPTPASGNIWTCSPKCRHKLKLENKRRSSQKKAAKREWPACRTPGCGEKFKPYKGSKYCPKHRGDYNQPHHKQKRNAKALQVYWNDPVKARAKASAKKKKALAKNPEKVRAKKRAAYRRLFAANPERFRAAGRKGYHKNIKKSRAQANARYARNAEKINARQTAAYWIDVELSRAKGRAKRKSRKERHPRLVRAQEKARVKRNHDKAHW
jgi:hypothetical protein